MKEEYSKINNPFLRSMKKNIQKNNQFIEECFKNLKLKYDNSEISEEDLRLYSNDLNFYQTILIDKIHKNYYIESKELSDFFCNTFIKKEIIFNFSKIIENNCNAFYETENIFTNSKISGEKVFCGIIHHKSFKRSLIFICTLRVEDNTVYIYIGDGDLKQYTPLNLENLKFINNENRNNNFNLVLNMLFYMDAFPDKISNTPPEEMCDKLNFNNSKTISISKDIEDYLHENREVSPHLRRGHFRYLDSEYYKNKKGQTVFVKSSFVKGKAVTVMD